MAETPWTVDWLKKVYLTGVRLTDADGVAFPDDIYTQAMANAFQWAQTTFNIVIPRTTYTERHDYLFTEIGNWWMIEVDRKPVRTVASVTTKIGTMPVVQVPSSWILQPSGGSGIVQMIPNPGEISSWAITAFGFQTMAALAQYGKFPGWYEVVYDAGYDYGVAQGAGKQMEVPYDILDLMGKTAAIPVLETAGDVIIGAGLANVSRSLDGVSQSFGSTNSSGNAGYAGRIKSWREQMARDIPLIRRRYHGVGLRVA